MLCISHLAFPQPPPTWITKPFFSCCRLMPGYMALVVGTCCTEVMDECNRGSFLILQKSFHEEVTVTEGFQQATVKKKATVTYSLPKSC